MRASPALKAGAPARDFSDESFREPQAVDEEGAAAAEWTELAW